MKYTLVQFKSLAKRGKYTAICFTTFDSSMEAFQAGLAMHKKLTPPYAGFMVKDSQGNTIYRVRKGYEK